MANRVLSRDPLISTEDEVEVDEKTAAAIERGLRAADEGRVVSSTEVRQRLLAEWNLNSSTQKKP